MTTKKRPPWTIPCLTCGKPVAWCKIDLGVGRGITAYWRHMRGAKPVDGHHAIPGSKDT